MLTRWLRRVRRVLASECRPRWTSHSTAPNCHLQAARQIARASAVVCCRTGTGSTHSDGSRCSEPARIVPKLENGEKRHSLTKLLFSAARGGNDALLGPRRHVSYNRYLQIGTQAAHSCESATSRPESVWLCLCPQMRLAPSARNAPGPSRRAARPLSDRPGVGRAAVADG